MGTFGTAAKGAGSSGRLVTFSLLWQTAHSDIALDYLGDALLTTGNQRLGPAMIGTERNRTQQPRGLDQEKGQKEGATLSLGWRGHGCGETPGNRNHSISHGCAGSTCDEPGLC